MLDIDPFGTFLIDLATSEIPRGARSIRGEEWLCDMTAGLSGAIVTVARFSIDCLFKAINPAWQS